LFCPSEPNNELKKAKIAAKEDVRFWQIVLKNSAVEAERVR